MSETYLANTINVQFYIFIFYLFLKKFQNPKGSLCLSCNLGSLYIFKKSSSPIRFVGLSFNSESLLFYSNKEAIVDFKILFNSSTLENFSSLTSGSAGLFSK